jgi:hypothetical protein
VLLLANGGGDEGNGDGWGDPVSTAIMRGRGNMRKRHAGNASMKCAQKDEERQNAGADQGQCTQARAEASGTVRNANMSGRTDRC